MSSSWTQADLAALEAAIKGGVLSVQFSDHAVTYRSLDDMMKLRATMRRDLSIDTGSRTHYAQFRKGPDS